MLCEYWTYCSVQLLLRQWFWSFCSTFFKKQPNLFTVWIQSLIRKDYNTGLLHKKKVTFDYTVVWQPCCHQPFFFFSPSICQVPNFVTWILTALLSLISQYVCTVQILFGTAIFIAYIPKLTTVKAETKACPDKCKKASGEVHCLQLVWHMTELRQCIIHTCLNCEQIPLMSGFF